MNGLRARVAQNAPSPIFNARALLFDTQSLHANCEGVFLLGGDVQQSCRNMADGSAWGPATPVGSIGVNSYSLALKTGAAFLSLPFADFPEMTMAVIGRSTDTNVDGAHRPVLLGTSDGSATGSNIFVTNTTQDRVNCYTATSGANNSDNTISGGPSTMRALIARVGATTCRLKNLTDSPADESGPTTNTGGRLLGARMKIGGGLGSAFAGTSEIVAAFVWSRQLSDAETLAWGAQVKAFYLPRGFAI